MRKLILSLLCALLVPTVCVAAPVQNSHPCECTERNEALLDDAIDSLLKSYRLNPRDQITRFYLCLACSCRWMCISNALLDLPPGAHETPEAKKLHEAMERVRDVLTEIEFDPNRPFDTPPFHPNELFDTPPIEHSDGNDNPALHAR